LKLAQALCLAWLGFATVASGDPLRLDSGEVSPSLRSAVPLATLLEGRDSRHVLVQLVRVPDAGEREALSRDGLTLLHYIPVRGYLARIDARALTSAGVSAWLEWSAPLSERDKQAATIRSGDTPAHALAADGRIRLVVKTFPGTPAPEMRAALAALGVEVTATLPVFDRLEVLAAPGTADAIAALDAVRWVRHGSPPPVDDADGMRADQRVNEVQSSPYHLTGVGIDIGQIEGGNPDADHDDFGSRVTWVTVEGPTVHATHVAGIMIGNGLLSSDRGGTPLQWRGVAPTAETKSWGAGGSYLSGYSSAITAHGIDLATNSWGWEVNGTNCGLYGAYDNDAPEHDLVITGLHGKRIPIFFSAGNERDDCDCGMSCTPPYVNYTTIRPPGATAKNTITVGAKYSDDPSPALFSSWGPLADGRLKPEIVASGDELGGEGGIRSTVPGDDYDVLDGTSMATPAAAGCAALFVEDFRTVTGGEPSPSLVKAMFVHTAFDLNDTSSTWLNPGPDYTSGFGRLRIWQAIDQLRTGDWLQGDVDQGEADVFTLAVPNDASWVRITLAWDDVAGAENADPALVNDLDLVVYDADGWRRLPWTLDPADPSAPALKVRQDHVNPLEQVYVAFQPPPGNWSVEVSGTVPFGPQPYSLVFSHDGSTPTDAPEIEAPLGLRAATLGPSHPNPFSPWTRISYALHAAVRVELRVLDVRGRLVQTLVPARDQAPGDYVYTWRGRDDSGRPVPSGVYLVELRAGGERSTTKVVLVR
jgi:subtilisin family serine protease